MTKLPTAKTENIVVQDLDKELLIYDLTNDKAYSLNETSKAVFKACDGQTTFDELKRKNKYTDELIYLTLDELKKNNLLDDAKYTSAFNRATRREIIRKNALASMIALPVVIGLTAPQAANAASVCAAGSPNSFGNRNGQAVGSPFTRTNPNSPETCSDYPQADRDNLCNLVYGNQCCSNKAVSENCTQVDPNRTTYSCVCAA